MTKKFLIIEYKISCDSTPDCGFIMMNVDGDDVAVPIASPSGKTPSEVMKQNSKNEKLYYFSPFDMYSENTVTGEVQALDPADAIDLRDNSQVARSDEKKQILKEQKQALKEQLRQAQADAKAFKKSDKFKKRANTLNCVLFFGNNWLILGTE